MIEFTVHGHPAPKGSKRIVQPKGHSRPMMLESSSKRQKSWRPAVRAACADVQLLAGPVMISVEFRFPRPASHLKKSGELRRGKPHQHVAKPDLSKLMRELEDVIVDCGVIDDDRFIVAYGAITKCYCPPGDEGCTAKLWSVPDGNENE